jgi:hypothetical protein
MTTTTNFGTWLNHAGSLTVEQTIADYVGDFADDYDLDAIARDYRDAVNEAMPHGVTLAGNEFYGPYYETDRDFDGYPADEHDELDMAAIIESVDFVEIVERHDKTA